MIYFEDGNSIINKSDISKSYRRYYSKSNSGISSGTIVAIVLGPIIVLASLMAAIYYFKKNDVKRQTLNNGSNSVEVSLNKNI